MRRALGSVFSIASEDGNDPLPRRMKTQVTFWKAEDIRLGAKRLFKLSQTRGLHREASMKGVARQYSNFIWFARGR
jgi:hypothetical protein